MLFKDMVQRFCLVSIVFGFLVVAVSSIPTDFQDEQAEEQPRPHAFKYSYAAGRAPNMKPDRYVEQEGDEDGVIKGTYTYLDPNWTWQTIKYEADPEGGFRIMEGSTLGTVKDTEAVAKAKAEHAALFANIAAAHEMADPAEPIVPQEAPAVQLKRQEQETLFQQIAEQHRQIAEEHRQLAERMALDREKNAGAATGQFQDY